MLSARSRFWIAIVLLAAIWLACLLMGGHAAAWDVALREFFFVERGSTLARNAAVFTQIGRAYVLVPLSLVAAGYLAVRRRRRAALFLFTTFGGRLLVELQKLIIDRQRPDLSSTLDSFPSGHAANSMITLLAIALMLPVRQRNRAIAVGIGLAVVLQVGASRVMIGVHWPSDVVGGWAFGLLWVMTCMRLASARGDPAPRRAEGSGAPERHY
jgi:undecaprenyl-diphosphatase